MKLSNVFILIVMLRELIVLSERAEYTKLQGPKFVENNKYFVSEREKLYQKILDFLEQVDNGH